MSAPGAAGSAGRVRPRGLARRVVSWPLVILGLVTLGVGGYFLRESWRWSRTAVPAHGVVSDLRPCGVTGRCKRLVAFRTAAGDARTFVDPLESKRCRFTRGEAVEVLYQPDDPGDARLRGSFETWAPPAAALGLGLFAVSFGALAFGRRRSAPGV